MNNRFSELFIRRPVATTLLTIGIALAGLLAFGQLPVSPLPQVDFPNISVSATMPGASPDTMASSVAAPLERHLGQIADVNEMTSSSSLGSTRIQLQFGLDRDIDGAARDVQAAINAARADLPTSLRSNPTYHKVNPADAPIMVLALTSTTRTAGQIYDIASNVLQQRLSQLDGIGEVDVVGSALPAVRVELNPGALFRYGIGLEDVRAALASANANSPKGAIEDSDYHYQIYANDQASHAADYRDLIVAYRNNAAVRLADVADVVDSVEDLRNAGLSNGKPSVAIVLSRQPGADIIEAVDGVKAVLPRLAASLPGDVDLTVVVDRSITIRGSLRDTERTLITAVALVIFVVFVFLRNPRAAAIPSVAVPVSIIGSFGVMYLLGFSLDNLSLMALTISTGFVVDDAIVVLENVTRHIEAGATRMQAAILGAREVGFTVLSISLSLIAVFLPLLLMGSIVGRLFREFAITLSIAVIDLAHRLADDDADDVLADPAAARDPYARRALSDHRARLRRHARLLSDDVGDGAAPSLDRHAHPAGDDRAQRPPLQQADLRSVPGAGHRAADRLNSGRPEHFLPVDEAEAGAVADDRSGRSGGGHRRRRHRRPANQFRLRLHLAEAVRPAPDQRRRRGRAAARQARRGGRRAALSGRRFGLAHRRAAEQRHLPIHPSLGRHGDALQMGAATDRGAAAERHPEGRQFRSAARRPRSRRDDRSADAAMRLGSLDRGIDNTLYDAFGQRQVSTIADSA